MKKSILTSYTFWIHVVIIVALFLMPVTFAAPDEELTLTTYLRRSVMPAVLLLVFYANYLWLVPRHLLQRHDRSVFWVTNVIMVIVLAICLGYWSSYIHRVRMRQEARIEHRANYDDNSGEESEYRRNYRDDRPHSRHKHKNRRHFIMLGFFRDLYSLTVAVLLATALRMSHRWIELEKRSKEVEVTLREAELNNLRNQINPHFLLNTLNNIYALTAFDQSKAQWAIMQLSKMLRHMLYDKKPVVNLSEEADFIHNYIDLMKIRVAGNVEVTENFDIPDPCHVQIAPMLFISLVENAFKHGISPTLPSMIRIDLKATDDEITCEITNTYYPKTEKDHSGHGIGQAQVSRRLDLMYPDKYEWEKGPTPDGKYYTSKLTIHDTKLHHY